MALVLLNCHDLHFLFWPLVLRSFGHAGAHFHNVACVSKQNTSLSAWQILDLLDTICPGRRHRNTNVLFTMSLFFLRLVQKSSLFCVSLSSSFLGILMEFIFPEPFHFENTDHGIYHKKMSGCLKCFPLGPFRVGYIFRY